VSDPLAASLGSGHHAPAAHVARALARSLAPAETELPLPPWLWPEQRPVCRQLLAAIGRFRGALLADPVGSGKTYVALAVARVINGHRPTVCLVPAALRSQWAATAARLGVAVIIETHERASRGRLPRAPAGLVLIDESHHYRNPCTRRYGHVAAWIGAQPVLLLSGTPAVNRLADVAHQLLLAVRDDALAPQGVPSLLALLDGGTALPALGSLVIARASAPGRPARVERSSAVGVGREPGLAPLIAAVERLRLSGRGPTAALLRGIFWRAAASSPAALAETARRYRRLLLHARDAAALGRTLDRRELRRFTGTADDQLVLWQLLPALDGGGDLDLGDLPALDGLVDLAAAASRRDDRRAAQLRELLADGRRTLVFSTARATVRYLRDRMTDPSVAWCTGAQAGIGHVCLPRASVLAWFQPVPPAAVAGSRVPRVLLATDVAAEGLDLQGAERVVHYDLPWTPMRLDQREGRAVRAGSIHARVEVARVDIAAELETRIGLVATIAAKTGLPARLGLGAAGEALWSWRASVAERHAGGESARGVAAIRAHTAGVLVGFALAGQAHVHSSVIWLDADGGWSEEAAVVGERLSEAARADDAGPPTDCEMERAIARLVPIVRQRLRAAHGARWSAAPPEREVRALAARLQAWAGAAARRRDIAALRRLERALAFVGGGHTAGEARLVRRLAELDDVALDRALAMVPEPDRAGELATATVVGVIVFRPDGRG
jgi:hypothetical protein